MPEIAARHPVAVLPLWLRGAAAGAVGGTGTVAGGGFTDADRPGVLRGHPGPAGIDQSGVVGEPGRAAVGEPG
ncbi:hypothetical protein ACIRD3_06950 [Kitasatospora sp. NPDC093550]|uniref:hypothetical protein n=1 Tax=Kitasatospora sp. NPDC093550 TaxID=3364089 RepID=UPI0037F4D2D8